MIPIFGNKTAQVQKKTTAKNEYGEAVARWEDVQTLTGFLDMLGGNANYTWNSKVVESTHVFICDYVPIEVTAENGRMIINGNVYEITYIDNPMELDIQIEIFLKFIGGLQYADHPTVQRVMEYGS